MSKNEIPNKVEEENGMQDAILLYLMPSGINQHGEILKTPRYPSEKTLLKTFEYLKKKDKSQCIQYLVELRFANVDILHPSIIDYIIEEAGELFEVTIELLRLPEKVTDDEIIIYGKLDLEFADGIDHNGCWDYEDIEDAASWIANITGYKVVIQDVKEKSFPQRKSPKDHEFWHYFSVYKLSEIKKEETISQSDLNKILDDIGASIENDNILNGSTIRKLISEGD